MPIVTPKAAERFLERVGFALRYQATKGLPIASLRSASGSITDRAALRLSIDLTNHLLGRAIAIEVNVIADRLTLVHRSIVPALYKLVRRDRAPDSLDGLTMRARTAATLFRQQRELNVGHVRHALGLKAAERHDPAYDTLAELQRAMLVDRGPFEIPKRGIPYLPPEGYPYHLFYEAHADLAQAAVKYSIESAAETVIGRFLSSAVLATPRKIASLFKAFLNPEEVRQTLDRLAEREDVQFGKVGRDIVVVAHRR